MTEEIKSFVKKHYPETAFYAVVKFDSEYDDSYYSHKVKCLAVYDVNKEEILPKKACTEAIYDMLQQVDAGGETSEERDDLVVIL